MGRTKKKTNRKNENRYVLDVKLRTDDLRKQRVRVASSILTVVFGTLFILFVAWRGVDWALDEFVYQNPAFAIHKFETQTDGSLAVPTILQWAGVRIGQNLLAVNLNLVKRNLERVPVIKAASVERLLPHALRIRIEERTPVAQAILLKPSQNGKEHVTYPILLDADGYVLNYLQRSQVTDSRVLDYGRLPELVGVDEEELRMARRVMNPQVRSALRLMSSFHRSPMAGYAIIRRVQVHGSDRLTVQTSDGSVVTFAAGNNFARQLVRWRQIHDVAFRTGKAVTSIDLSVTNNIPVLWRDAAVPPPDKVGEKPKRTYKLRSKNV